ncbi:MAG: hypothetical protein GVY19_09210 [Bacteroidetes bacterium]|jgi:hypothetical protein|nr:hypothetical protein [Bacteroidota bacterium]
MNEKVLEKSIQQHFDNARSGSDFTLKLIDQITQQYNVDINKLLLATSLCSDEINPILYRLIQTIGNPFFMGGLAGYPFTGITGIKAFASHIPDQGAALILYGPHIGIAEDGEAGVLLRPYQKQPTTSCGALMMALQLLEKELPEVNKDDQQFQELLKLLSAHKNEIAQSENEKMEITLRMFKIIDTKMKELLQSNIQLFNGKKIFLVGGIVINTSPDYEDYFETLTNEVLNN